MYRTGRWGDDLRARGRHVYGIEEHGGACRRRGVARLRALRRRVRRLDRILVEERIDVVHTQEKNHEVLLHAFARVLRHVPDARLFLVGGG